MLDKLPVGNNANIREVRSPQDLEKLWKWLQQNGVERPGAYGPVPGVWKDLPDGTGVGQRDAAGSTGKAAIDIKIAGEKGNVKVHINPQRGGVPEVPVTSAKPAVPESPAAAKPAVPEAPRGAAPVEAPSMRGGPLGGVPLGGAVPDGSMPYPVEPPTPDAAGPDLPVIGDGKPD